MVSGHSFIQFVSTQKALIYGAQTACSRIRSAKVGLDPSCNVLIGSILMSKCGSATLLMPPRGADDVCRRPAGDLESLIQMAFCFGMTRIDCLSWCPERGLNPHAPVEGGGF